MMINNDDFRAFAKKNWAIFLANVQLSIIDWSAAFGKSRTNKGNEI